MKYIHTTCGGTIDLRTRKCSKCKKRWSRFSLLFDPTGIRQLKEPSDYRVMTKEEELSTLQRLLSTKVPGGRYAVWFSNLLPKWPRWARVLSTLLALGGLTYLVVWLVIR